MCFSSFPAFLYDSTFGRAGQLTSLVCAIILFFSQNPLRNRLAQNRCSIFIRYKQFSTGRISAAAVELIVSRRAGRACAYIEHAGRKEEISMAAVKADAYFRKKVQ